MRTIEKTRLEPCDVVVVGGMAYRVEARIRGRRCSRQCHLYDHDAQRCPGTCWRWDNADDVCFRYLLPADEMKAESEVVVTPTWRLFDERMHDERQLERKARRVAQGMPYVTKPSTGTVYLEGDKGYRAKIIVAGRIHTHRVATPEEGWAWLDEFKKAHGLTREGHSYDTKLSKGNIEQPIGRRVSFRADITIKGVRYRAAFPTREEAMEWLRKIKAEKGVK